MKILHILDHSIPLHSGYTFRTRSILKQQRANGWETFHVTSPKHNIAINTMTDREEVDGLEFYRTSQAGGIIGKLPLINQLSITSSLEKRLYEIIPEIKPDILHAHSPALNGEAAIRAGKHFDIPVVYEVRAFWEDAAVDHGTSKAWGIRYRLSRAYETRVLRRADAVTTICEGLRNEMIGRGIPESKVTVIPNAVNIEDFSVGMPPDSVLAEQLGLKGKKTLGFIGSFYAYEGLSLLIQALPMILQHDPDVRVLLVGGGPQEENLKRLASDLGLNNKVIFTGRVPHDQVQKHYDLIDILVYPRLSMRLTDLVTPLKPLEAMAQGRVVLASDVGGHLELIEPGVTGYLFKAGDISSLSNTVLETLNNSNEWEKLRAAGRRYVETERNWKVSVSRYQNIYTSLLDNVQ